MNRTPLDLEALQVLDTVDRAGSFAGAAARLHRVPSAISYTVHKLERDLGVRLYDRSGYRATLTPTGKLVLEEGRRILAAAEALTFAARQVAGGWEPVLRIAVDTLLPLAPLYPLVADFRRQQSGTDVRISEEVLGGSLEALTAGRADLLLGLASSPPSGYASRVIGEVELVFVAPPGHPLADLPGPVPSEVARSYPAVAVADSARHSPPLTTGLIGSQPLVTVPTMAEKILAHGAGLGVGFVPRFRVDSCLRAGRLVEIPLAEPRPPVTLRMAWRASEPGRALRWFLDRLRSAALMLDPNLSGARETAAGAAPPRSAPVNDDAVP